MRRARAAGGAARVVGPGSPSCLARYFTRMPSTARIAWRRSSLGPAPARQLLELRDVGLALEREGEHVAVEVDDAGAGGEQPRRSADRLEAAEHLGPRIAHVLQGDRTARRRAARLVLGDRGGRRATGAADAAAGSAPACGRSRPQRARTARRRGAAMREPTQRGGTAGAASDARSRAGAAAAGCRCPGLREHTGDHELELQPRRRRAGHLVERRDDEIGGARQPRATPKTSAWRIIRASSSAEHPAQHGRGALTRRRDRRSGRAGARAGRRRSGADPDRSAPPGRPRRRRPRHPARRTRRRPRRAARRACSRAARPPARSVTTVAFGAGDQLVEQRQRVAGRPAARAHDERQHARLDRDALGLAELLDVLEHRRRAARAGTG